MIYYYLFLTLALIGIKPTKLRSKAQQYTTDRLNEVVGEVRYWQQAMKKSETQASIEYCREMIDLAVERKAIILAKDNKIRKL